MPSIKKLMDQHPPHRHNHIGAPKGQHGPSAASLPIALTEAQGPAQPGLQGERKGREGESLTPRAISAVLNWPFWPLRAPLTLDQRSTQSLKLPLQPGMRFLLTQASRSRGNSGARAGKGDQIFKSRLAPARPQQLRLQEGGTWSPKGAGPRSWEGGT